jgi:DNA polymerase-3 subunit beta
MSSETRGVKLTFGNGALHIAGDNPDIGEVREELEAEYEGDEVSVGFNPKYVLELLGQMETARVSVELSGELDPGMIKPVDGDEYLGVVMPMRI